MFGRSDDRQLLFWLTDGEPDDWPVLLWSPDRWFLRFVMPVTGRKGLGIDPQMIEQSEAAIERGEYQDFAELIRESHSESHPTR
jgi:hypothetical protein